jgi:Uma2 family endonuclease
MPSSSREATMTIDEYFDETDETTRPRELAFGLLREPPAPFYSHQRLVLRIARMWSDHVETHGLGTVAVAPVDVVLDRERHLIVQPDVLFISTNRLEIVANQVWGAPDLVAEVMSPGTQAHDRGEKLGWYRQYGVRECWLVDGATDTITIVDFTGADPIERRAGGFERLRSAVLPDLRLMAFRVFA